MPWFKGDDKAYANPKLRAVATKSKTAGFGILFCWLYAAQQGTDGWLPQWVVDNEFSPAELRAVTTVKANGRAPLLHKRGDECPCLHGSQWTEEMGGYWLHDWLKHNPSKAENNVHRAKGRELGDPDLRALVMLRDGNACRYCGIVVPWADRKSSRMLTIDHVNPTLAAGAGNLVVACMQCNARKKDAIRPESVGLTLLGPPINPPAEWPKGTDPSSIERADPAPLPRSTTDRISDQISRKSPENQADNQVVDQVIDHRSDQVVDHRSAGDQPSGPRPRDQSAQNQEPQVTAADGGSGDATSDGLPLGRGGGGSGPRTSPDLRAGDVGPQGRRPQVGPATTPRSAESPPTYRKGATSNPPPPDRPPGDR